MSGIGASPAAPARPPWLDAGRLAGALRAAVPALLFGLRLWAAVSLALYIAFWLELDNAFWAGNTAAFVFQPTLGASLRRGWFRVVGTVIGAVAIVTLSACFPQQRIAFLVGLALWCAASALIATLLRSFAAYAAAMCTITAAIIASDELGAIGGTNGDVFRLAVARGSEICIGVVSAGVVLAGTDFGDAPRRLARLFAGLVAEIGGRFAAAMATVPAELSDNQPLRRELVRRVIALDPVIDEVMGESSRLRPLSPALQRAVDGLFGAIAGWRTVAVHLARLPRPDAQTEADVVLQPVPPELRAIAADPGACTGKPLELRRACAGAAQQLLALPGATPSLRLLADRSAEVWTGLAAALDGVALLIGDPARPRRGGVAGVHIADWLPALVNAARTFVAMCLVAVFWIVSDWPGGATAVAFAAIGSTLFAPRADQAYAAVMGFMIGVGLAVAAAAVVKFALLPDLETFAGLSLALGLVLVPAGAFMSQPWQNAMFTAIAGFFVTVVSPANEMTYDIAQFANFTLAILVGVSAAALSFRLMPPLPPALRTRRLLMLTLRDLRRLAAGPPPQTAERWQRRLYDRLSALPDPALPLQRSQLVAALSLGSEMIALCRLAGRLELGAGVKAVLSAVARGDVAAASDRLERLDQSLAERPGSLALQARSIILAMTETLAQHAAYFAAGAP